MRDYFRMGDSSIVIGELSMHNFKIGQLVEVKDKTPKPPKHHKKRLKKWLDNHFNGEVVKIRGDDMLIKNLDSSNSVIDYTFWIYENSNQIVIPK